MSFCISLPNYVQIGTSATELWRHIHFSRWRPRHRNSTSDFGFRESAHLGRSQSTRVPNFGEVSQSTAEILLLPVSEKQTSAMLEFYFRFHIFYFCITIGMSFCICLPNFVQIGPSATELWRHISNTDFVDFWLFLFFFCSTVFYFSFHLLFSLRCRAVY